MPVTPLFRLAQDDAHVLVEIRAPYMRAASMEMDVDGCEFRFFARPQYFLRLTFESGVEEIEDECAKYDVEAGVLTVRLRKAVTGLHFRDLDMLSKLLAPPARPQPRPPASRTGLIEELGGHDDEVDEVDEDDEDGEDGEDGEEEDGPESLWETQQRALSAEEYAQMLGRYPYGFDNRHSNLALECGDELASMLDLPDPDGTPVGERSARMRAAELAAFDPEYYCMDYLEGARLRDALETMQPFWRDAQLEAPCATWAAAAWEPWEAASGERGGAIGEDDECGQEVWANVMYSRTGVDTAGMLFPRAAVPADAAAAAAALDDGPPPPAVHWTLEWTVHERDLLAQIPYRTLGRASSPAHELRGILDALFAYAYNARCFLGDRSCESDWTVVKLCATLSWFVRHDSVRDVLLSGCRRALIYPLYRHFALVAKCVEDVARICALGRRAVLRALLELYDLLRKSETYYYLCRLYVVDWILFVQQAVDDAAFSELSREVCATLVTKADLADLELDRLDSIALAAMVEEE